jgi:hypothetical protein
VPLSGNPASTLDYLLIDEALETKKMIVDGTESGQDGDYHPGKDWRYDRQKSIVDFSRGQDVQFI